METGYMEGRPLAALVTNVGIKAFIDALVAANAVRHVGWGTGNGQGVTDTDLATAANEDRVAGTLSAEDTNTTDDTFQCVAEIEALGARAITEVGIFDGAGTGNPPSGANLDFYADFAVINLDTGDSIEFTLKAVIDQAA